MKRVLFITYYFPPSGGSGVQRPVKFVKYLPQFGWQPTVLTVLPEFASFVDVDTDMAADIPDDVEVVRTKSWDPYGLYAKMKGSTRKDSIIMHMAEPDNPDWKDRVSMWMRANVFLPDARVGWVPFVVRKARALHREKPFDAIITTGPPHSVHLAGRRISRLTGVPWLADFRDPWTTIFYREKLPTLQVVERFEKKLERSIAREADAVVTVSKRDQKYFEELRQQPVALVHNGFDPADVESYERSRHEHFEVAHVGVLNETRSPESLWQALAKFTGDATFQVRLTGRLDDSVRDQVRVLQPNLIVEPNVDHQTAIGRMFGADLLVFIVNRGAGNESMIPAKIFEYIATGIPILGIGPVDGDAATLLSDLGAGQVFDYDDVQGISDFVSTHYSAWTAGSPINGCSAESIARFSRVHLASRLADVLTSISTS